MKRNTVKIQWPSRRGCVCASPSGGFEGETRRKESEAFPAQRRQAVIGNCAFFLFAFPAIFCEHDFHFCVYFWGVKFIRSPVEAWRQTAPPSPKGVRPSLVIGRRDGYCEGTVRARMCVYMRVPRFSVCGRLCVRVHLCARMLVHVPTQLYHACERACLGRGSLARIV